MSQLSTNDVYQLHIRLVYIEPPIWRRIVVTGHPQSRPSFNISRKLIKFCLRQLLWPDCMSCWSHLSTIFRSSLVTFRMIVPTTSVSIPP